MNIQIEGNYCSCLAFILFHIIIFIFIFFLAANTVRI